MKSRAFAAYATAFIATIMSACSNSDEYMPAGQWEATEDLYVYTTNDHPLKIAFVIEKVRFAL